MRPVIFIRIAAVLAFIHAVLHTIGGVFGKVGPGPAAVAAVAMKSNQFVVMGNPRTFWDFYMGLGLASTVSLSMEALVLWFLASLARNHADRLRPILLTFAVGYLALSVNSYEHFFFGPVIAEILMALCLVAAVISIRSPNVREHTPGSDATA
jgi:hypothetical protein